jgi:DNA-binding transcriptional regulator GbsR (MarR family)
MNASIASDETTTGSPETEATDLIQKEMAEIFADLSELFGNPASLGSIYGLLFASPEPISMEEIVDKLDISVGTASQGLRRLAELEAISSIKAEGQRITRYSAKLELRHYVSVFLYQQLLPKLERSNDRIQSLKNELPKVAPALRETLQQRIDQASKWHRLGKTLLPLLKGFIRG